MLFAELKRLASQAEERIFGVYYQKLVKLLCLTPRMGGGGPPLKEQLSGTGDRMWKLPNYPSLAKQILTISDGAVVDLQEGQILCL